MNLRTSSACSGWLARGFALFFGSFSLLNVLGEIKVAGFDANIWWLDVRWLPSFLATPFILVSSLFLVVFGIRPAPSGWRRIATIVSAALLATVAWINSLVFFRLETHGSIFAGVPIPLSLLVLAALLHILFYSLHINAINPAASRLSDGGTNRTLRDWVVVAGVATVCGLIFPLAQMFCFGKTDYRRPGDVAVVFGARVYADGHLSDALADRVRTACQLYREGTVKKLLFSGGPGDGSVHETEGMKQVALQLGVRAEDVLLDKEGFNTRATAHNAERICSSLHYSRVLVVSHFYHLPRIKLSFQRDGWEVLTVPARESYWLRQMPYNIAREVVALWVYYLRPMLPS